MISLVIRNELNLTRATLPIEERRPVWESVVASQNNGALSMRLQAHPAGASPGARADCDPDEVTCCADAEIGHAAAVPPSKLVNSRRLIRRLRGSRHECALRNRITAITLPTISESTENTVRVGSIAS